MKVTRKRGLVRLWLEPPEVEVLITLLNELASTLSDRIDSQDPVHQRLFPAGYRDDVEAEVAFRSLTESGLRNDRLDRIDACSADLASAYGEFELDADAGQRWIQVLNDIRLTIGTLLVITEDEPAADPMADDFEQRLLYHWLTALQDSLVHALMR